MSSSSSSNSKLLEINIPIPFTDQKPGTSGLRKSTKNFFQPHYLETFIEATLQSLPGVVGGTLVLGGDGRFGNNKAIDLILRMCAAHKLRRVITTKNGILSTPAASHLIRTHKAIGGIILSASHNPGGLQGDFGVKINGSNGGPANETLTNKIFNCSKNIRSYKILKIESPELNSSKEAFLGEMKVEIIDGVDDYLHLMQKLFDFDQISDLLKGDFSIAFDALNAVTGPYAKRIFEGILGSSEGTVLNGFPQEDFGGLHPDPNLTYAKELADLLLDSNSAYSFGAACDGDGDRNMILGRGCFVNPSDSLAVIAANYKSVPAYSNGLKGVARSMPTSSAVDLVAKELGIPCFETPTGWKYFGNLLDAGEITICGEESFGTGSDHIREKDGLWAVLFWLQILADTKKSVGEIMSSHWQKFGRNFYSRHDYEGIPSDIADTLYSRTESLMPKLLGEKFASTEVTYVDNFSYKDPIDYSLTKNQGLRIILADGSRVILRLSGTGTQGATLRIYLERYVSKSGNLNQNPQLALKDLIQSIDAFSEIRKRTGMTTPTVIT